MHASYGVCVGVLCVYLSFLLILMRSRALWWEESNERFR